MGERGEGEIEIVEAVREDRGREEGGRKGKELRHEGKEGVLPPRARIAASAGVIDEVACADDEEADDDDEAEENDEEG